MEQPLQETEGEIGLDSGERSWKGARTNIISCKATSCGNQLHRIFYPIMSFILLLLLQFLREDLTAATPHTPVFFLQRKGKIKPATAHPWWPLPSGCPALHPPAMKAKNLAVPLSSPQPHLDPYPQFPLTQLCRANYWNFFAASLACGWKHSATDPKVGTAIGIRIEPKNARFPVGLCACLHFQDVLFLIITKANNTRQRLMKVLWS